VRIWSVATGKSLTELRGHIDQVTYVTYSADGKYVLSAGDDSTARVWRAEESGVFDVAQPIISVDPSNNPIGECPITVRFVVNLTVKTGRGKIVYRFKGSDGRIWPPRESVFDGPGTTYVNWYWKITQDYTGFETIEILEPKGLKEQKAKFTVVCTNNPTSHPEATPAATPK
jgi:WD40 repeat protein